MKQGILDQSRDLLLTCTRPLLIAHVEPDGDAVGSLLGLGWALRALGKSPLLACPDRLPRRFAFLPGFHDVTDDPQGSFDLCVALDCSDPERMGQIALRPDLQDVPLLNIDHHRTNPAFGTINLVDADAASTTQVLYDLICHLGVPLDERIATCLLTGLVTDTRGFRTANVTLAVMRIVVALMEAGAPLTEIARRGLDQQPLSVLRVWGAALAQAEVVDGVVWTSLPLATQQAVGHNSSGSAGLSNTLISAEEAQVAVVFKERADGQVDVGLRAVPGFDVAGIAQALGGGGHALAAGCLVEGPLVEAQERVLSLVRTDLARQRERLSGGNERHPESE